MAGVTAAGLLLLVAALVVTVPMTVAPVLATWLLPEVHWRVPPRWWFVPVGAIVLLVLAFAASAFEAALAVLFPRAEQRRLREVVEAAAGVLALTGVYAVLLTPWAGCLATGAGAWAVAMVREDEPERERRRRSSLVP